MREHGIRPSMARLTEIISDIPDGATETDKFFVGFYEKDAGAGSAAGEGSGGDPGELVAVLGPAGKNATANIEALEELPWSSEEYRNLSTQMKNLAAITAYPGSYIIGRYTNFAFLNAYNNHADPVDSLLNYINTINKEINRKRKEFDYETLEIGQNLAQKRMGQAEELMANLSGYDALVAAAREAIEASSIEGLEASAAAFGAAGTSEELGQISSYLSEAAAALRSYQQ